eukprot:CAMPEP_0171457412 /NCGR_PEP_ID=MMETSP0945-20130129/3508_1 /TAXON_ID=109269 /ORGANISM="Vaucheria litorea, Strain CCMP2940" /LENGTH=574 /DNA_ID=CAMNT_0011983029 /DNA_START=203 /DNA_END=1924 /DNA_ORIENTATION=-
MKHCPFCHDTKGKLDNLWKLYIGIEGGAFYCHRCEAQGSWYDFKRKVGGHDHYQIKPPTNSYNGKNSFTSPNIPDQVLARSYISRLFNSPSASKAQDFLKKRGISKEVLQSYGVGSSVYKFPVGSEYKSLECLTFPWYLLRSDMSSDEFDGLVSRSNFSNVSNVAEVESLVSRIKVRAIDYKSLQRLEPAGGLWGLFGWHTIPSSANQIVITEGEFDAMAVYQETKYPTVSLPNGCRNLPVEIISLLERFEIIYLWMDNDQPGQEGAAKFAKKLGERRVRIVRPRAEESSKCKDANEAMLNGKNLMEMIEAAQPIQREDILMFSDLKDKVMHEIQNPDEYVGKALQSFPLLTKIIKGFRPGELSVFTGGTGVGKTTMLSQMSLDLAKAGTNVLWGSFEVQNTRLIKKMLHQFGRKPLTEISKKQQGLPALMERFSQLPLLFMSFHGGTEVDLVLEAMDYAVYANDASHIILDNLQFMISSSSTSNKYLGGLAWNKFDAQDVAMEKFRKFATERNVHITLVIHPRKEQDERMPLTMTSVFGSAKMTQEADLVFILQRAGGKKSIEVKKNRYDGTV